MHLEQSLFLARLEQSLFLAQPSPKPFGWATHFSLSGHPGSVGAPGMFLHLKHAVPGPFSSKALQKGSLSERPSSKFPPSKFFCELLAPTHHFCESDAVG